MSPRTPRNVIALTPGGDITMDMILGWYVVSVIPDGGVSVATLRKEWIRGGLDPSFIPKNRKAVNAFQVAARSVETRRQVAENGDSLRTTEVRVEEVLEDGAECVYQVTHLVRDRAERIIEHPKAMRVVFNKKDEAISWDPLDGVLSGPALHDLGERITEHFERNANKVTGYKVREAMRKTLQSVHAVKIANGKLWFIPKAGRGTLEDLNEALSEVYKRESSYEFTTIPVAAAEGQKELIGRHFEMNILERCSKLTADINERIARDDDALRSDRLATLMQERAEVIREIERFKDILDLSLVQADEQALLLTERLETLINQTGTAGKSIASAA